MAQVGSIEINKPNTPQPDKDPFTELKEILTSLDNELLQSKEMIRAWDNLDDVIRTRTEEPVVMIVGATGSGKSTLFNALTRSNISPSGSELYSKTTIPIASFIEYNDKRWILVDTMGLSDTRNPQTSRKILKSTFALFPQVNTIILTLSSRATKEVRLEIKYLFEEIWDVKNTNENLIDTNLIVVRSGWRKGDKDKDEEFCRNLLNDYVDGKKKNYPVIYFNVETIDEEKDFGFDKSRLIIASILKTIPGHWSFAQKWRVFTVDASKQFKAINEAIGLFMRTMKVSFKSHVNDFIGWVKGKVPIVRAQMDKILDNFNEKLRDHLERLGDEIVRRINE